MAHDIFNDRFFSERREWHDIGPKFDTPMLATQAWNSLSPYVISLENLRTEIPSLEVSTRALVRHPVPDDPKYRQLGVVGMEYILIDPQRFCELFDEAVGVHIQTLGSLGKGETLFISTKLPTIDVRGDEIENYMVVVSPYVGNTAYELIVTQTRVVCQNTLRAARRQSTESYRIVHDRDSESNLRSWMSGMYQRSSQRVETMKQFFGILADFRPTADQTASIINTVYEYPVDPRDRPNAPVEVIDLRMPEFERQCASIDRTRQAVRELFEGRGTGLQATEIAGTGWALWNGFTEWESWRRTTNENSRVESLLIGSRVQTIQKAYSAVLQEASVS